MIRTILGRGTGVPAAVASVRPIGDSIHRQMNVATS
jgi:hypothetical protein